MIAKHGPVVIDWRNARLGHPDVDVALTAVILAQVAVDPAHPAAAPAGTLITEFLRYALAIRTAGYRKRWRCAAPIRRSVAPRRTCLPQPPS